MRFVTFKRIFDFFAAFLGLIVLSPICLIIALLISFESEGPVIFKQERMGKDLKPFTIYKFRTMTMTAPQNCATRELERPDTYITNIGKFLRKTSLDEIPQLFNVLKGDMSFIGPRPVVLTEEELILKRLVCRVYEVKPGLSGWAQIHGRDHVPVDEKVYYDQYYVQHFGGVLDFIIFWKTVVYVLRRKDVKEGTHVQIPSLMEHSLSPAFNKVVP